MSAALYSVRLMWVGGRGDMAAGGVHAHLKKLPVVLYELGIEEIQYEPALKVFWCRGVHGEPRDLSEAERVAARAWLDSKAAAFMAVIEDVL